MSDMLATIVPKSDQLNADDLIGGSRTITITRVMIDTKSDQPVSLYFEGDDGKPYKACKSMRRVLVAIWGADANAYIGRSMTIYRDDAVKFGGMDVGGIRISHMTNIERDVTMALTATRANRKPFTVRPLRLDDSVAGRLAHEAGDAAGRGVDAYRAFWRSLSRTQQAQLLPRHEEFKLKAESVGKVAVTLDEAASVENAAENEAA